MAAQYSNTYTLNAYIENICEVVRDMRFYDVLSLKLNSVTHIQNGMLYRYSNGISLTSWGENIDITILYINDNSSQVTIKSECTLPTQIVDWGKNKSNVEKLYNHLITCMTAYFQSMNNAQYQPMKNQNFNNSQPQQTPRPVFCRTCGKQLNASSRFCNMCGTQVF